eukprot:jgi/Botrbrau1/19555/Bobra.0035s0047.1
MSRPLTPMWCTIMIMRAAFHYTRRGTLGHRDGGGKAEGGRSRAHTCNADSQKWDSSTVVADTDLGPPTSPTVGEQAEEILRLHPELRGIHSRASMAALLDTVSNGLQHLALVPLSH